MKSKDGKYLKALRFDWLTKHYDRIVAMTTRESYFKKKLIAQSHLKDNDMIIDIGSGTGTLAIMIKKSNPKLIVTGVDADAQIISIAEKKLAIEGVKVSFEAAMSNNLPFKDESYECCFSSLFFHHLTDEDKSKTFIEIFRVLNQGGQLHVADWGKPTNFIMRLLFFIVQFLDGFETTSSNVKGKLPELMRKAGFSDVKTVQEIPTMLGTMTVYSARKLKKI